MKNLKIILTTSGVWLGLVFFSWLLRDIADQYNLQIIHSMFIGFLITYLVKTWWYDKHKLQQEKSVKHE